MVDLTPESLRPAALSSDISSFRHRISRPEMSGRGSATRIALRIAELPFWGMCRPCPRGMVGCPLAVPARWRQPLLCQRRTAGRSLAGWECSLRSLMPLGPKFQASTCSRIASRLPTGHSCPRKPRPSHRCAGPEHLLRRKLKGPHSASISETSRGGTTVGLMIRSIRMVRGNLLRRC
jgi:hypothetical protein